MNQRHRTILGWVVGTLVTGASNTAAASHGGNLDGFVRLLVCGAVLLIAAFYAIAAVHEIGAIFASLIVIPLIVWTLSAATTRVWYDGGSWWAIAAVAWATSGLFAWIVVRKLTPRYYELMAARRRSRSTKD